MSVTLMRLVRDNRHPDVTPAMKLTLMTLASHHWDKQPEAGTRVTTRRLAADTGFGLRAVQKHLVALESLGLIERSLPEKRTWVRLGANVGSRETNVGSPLRNQGPRQEEEHQGPKGLTAPERGTEQRGDPMPDPRLDDQEPEFEDTPAKDRTRKKTTGHKTAVTFFVNQAAARFRIWDMNKGALNDTVKTLAKGHHAMTYDDVIDYMEYWLVRKDAEIRRRRSTADRGPFDIAIWFRQSVNDGMVEVWKREQSSTSVNSAFGAKSMNEKLGL